MYLLNADDLGFFEGAIVKLKFLSKLFNNFILMRQKVKKICYIEPFLQYFHLKLNKYSDYLLNKNLSKFILVHKLKYNN